MEGRGFPRAGRAEPSDLKGEARGKSLKSSTASPTNPVLHESFTQIYILFPICFCIDPPKCTDGSVFAFLKFYDCSVLALLKPIEGSVLALLRLPSIFSHKNSTVREFCVPLLLCKKSRSTPFFFFFLKKNIMPFLSNKNIRLIVCI